MWRSIPLSLYPLVGMAMEHTDHPSIFFPPQCFEKGKMVKKLPLLIFSTNNKLLKQRIKIRMRSHSLHSTLNAVWKRDEKLDIHMTLSSWNRGDVWPWRNKPGKNSIVSRFLLNIYGLWFNLNKFIIQLSLCSPYFHLVNVTCYVITFKIRLYLSLSALILLKNKICYLFNQNNIDWVYHYFLFIAFVLNNFLLYYFPEKCKRNNRFWRLKDFSWSPYISSFAYKSCHCTYSGKFCASKFLYNQWIIHTSIYCVC